MSTPSEKQRFSSRLNDALDNIQFPKLGAGRQARLAEMMEAAPQAAGQWLKGEAFPPTSVLVKLAQLTKTRSNWLLSGTGTAYDKGENPRGPDKNPPPVGKEKLSKEAFELGLAWMKLPEEQREVIERLVRVLSPANE
jgi:transcriptional regulator with XRE-family HTH domain